MAEKVGIEPEKPRVARRQAHRSNNPSTSVEEHYRVNAAIPFLDHVIENLNNKFDSEKFFHIQRLKFLFFYPFIFNLELSITAAKLLKLTPSVMLSYSEEDFNLK